MSVPSALALDTDHSRAADSDIATLRRERLIDPTNSRGLRPRRPGHRASRSWAIFLSPTFKQAAAASFQCHQLVRRAAQAAPHGDGLRARWPGELAAELAAAVVGERANQLVRGRVKNLQRGATAGARRLD